MHEKQHRTTDVVLDVRVEIRNHNNHNHSEHRYGSSKSHSDDCSQQGGQGAASLHVTAMEPRETGLDDDEGGGNRYSRDYGGEGHHDHQRQTRQRQKWKTARTIVGAFSLVLSLALLGLGVKMSVAYDEVHLIHVSVAFIGFTVSLYCS